MAEMIGVRFKRGGKIYYFRTNGEQVGIGDYVVVETVRGSECGEVVMDDSLIDAKDFNREVKPIVRKATKDDIARLEENKRKAKRAFDICNQKIKAHGLAMNLLEVEYTFDNSKIVFNFSAEGRVDFRELVKDLASVFRARIELRQIGVRDEAKMLGGLGVCGRPFCCKQFMGDFQSVSIKMAKEQGLSLNPVKISGTCGRLMCCLKHEQDTYEELMRLMPAVGSTVRTPDGEGVVVERELIAGRVKVRMNDAPEAAPKVYKMIEGEDGSFRFCRKSEPAFDGIGDDIADAFGEPVADEPAGEPERSDERASDRRNSRGGKRDRRDRRENAGTAARAKGSDVRREHPAEGKKNGARPGGKQSRPKRAEQPERTERAERSDNHRPKGSAPRPGKGKNRPHPPRKNGNQDGAPKNSEPKNNGQ